MVHRHRARSVRQNTGAHSEARTDPARRLSQSRDAPEILVRGAESACPRRSSRRRRRPRPRGRRPHWSRWRWSRPMRRRPCHPLSDSGDPGVRARLRYDSQEQMAAKVRTPTVGRYTRGGKRSSNRSLVRSKEPAGSSLSAPCLAKVRGEWRLVCLTHNLLKIWRTKCAPAGKLTSIGQSRTRGALPDSRTGS